MKIKIHDYTYIFVLLSFLAGYFEYVFIFLIFIFVHESGHYILGLLLKFNINKIIIYPFGGITIFNEKLNISIKKEFIVLIGGITFQLLFYLLCIYLHNNNLITDHVFNIVSKVHILLVSFNFLPILPLDGGKLINVLLDIFLPYKISHKISVVISIFFIIIFSLNNISFLGLVLTIFLIKSIILEINNISIKYNNFLLERYLYNFDFNKFKRIRNINMFKREYYHIINNSPETIFLHNLFDRSK